MLFITVMMLLRREIYSQLTFAMVGKLYFRVIPSVPCLDRVEFIVLNVP